MNMNKTFTKFNNGISKVIKKLACAARKSSMKYSDTFLFSKVQQIQTTTYFNFHKFLLFRALNALSISSYVNQLN